MALSVHIQKHPEAKIHWSLADCDVFLDNEIHVCLHGLVMSGLLSLSSF